MYKQDGRFVQTMDCRFPTTTDGETLENTIRAAVGEAGTLIASRADAPFYIEADTPAIRACIDTYNEVTGENATPFTMGGGTYARHFPTRSASAPSTTICSCRTSAARCTAQTRRPRWISCWRR